MKLKLIPSVMLSLLFIVVIISCNDKPSIVGRWTPIKVDQKYFESNHPSEERLKELYQDEKAEFTKDGKFLAPSKGDTAHGTYVYDESQKKLLITVENENKPMSFTVQFSGKDQISLTKEDQTGTITFKRY